MVVRQPVCGERIQTPDRGGQSARQSAGNRRVGQLQARQILSIRLAGRTAQIIFTVGRRDQELLVGFAGNSSGSQLTQSPAAIQFGSINSAAHVKISLSILCLLLATACLQAESAPEKAPPNHRAEESSRAGGGLVSQLPSGHPVYANCPVSPKLVT